VAAIMAAWEELPPQLSVPLPFSAYQSIMETLQEGVAAIVVDGGNALDEIQIAQGLLQSIFLKALAKENADAAKPYDILRNLPSQSECIHVTERCVGEKFTLAQ
jgi:hypothetical protein